MQIIDSLSKITNALELKLQEAMASLVRQPVDLKLSNSGLITITEVHKWLESPEDSFTAVYIPIMGEVTGDIFVFMSQSSACLLADTMIGNDPGTTTFISDFESSAIKEMGNITTGVIITEMANILKISMMLTVPNLATDMVGALVDQVLIEYGETANQLLALQFPFSVNISNQIMKGNFVLFFDQASTDIIKTKLTEIN